MAKKYNVAQYIRLSRKDGDKSESDSIVNQRDLLSSYIKHHSDELVFFGSYEDDDYTGTNFDRPAFKKMMTDIENGKVNCVIVKDLSRFGRDYVDVGNYLQKIFPQMGIRFIAINDNIDSFKQAYDMTMPFKNIFNEHYARDISSKVLSAIKTKQQNGQFIGAFASYGYFKDENHKGKLVVDPYATQVIKRIFSLFIEGKGQITIAKILNDEKILCPSEYKKSLNLKYHNATRLDSTSYWTYSSIHKILQNEMYIGNMVQHKSNHSRYRGTKSRLVDKSDWIIVPNTHEPIISKETFEIAQSLLTHRTRDMGFNENVTIFAGFLQCADCGRSMAKISNGRRIRYVCGTYKTYSSSFCSSHRLFEDELTSLVLSLINNKIRQVKNIVAYIEKRERDCNLKHSNVNVEKNILMLKTKLKKASDLKRGLYEDYKNEILTKAEYLELKSEYTKEEINLNNQLSALQDIKADELSALKNNPWVQKFKNYKEITELSRSVLDAFIKVIKVKENSELEIEYVFNEELLSLATAD